jgi:hypothetical protein
MRYLSSRDQFLKESKFTGLQKYETTPYTGEEFKLYENQNAGPFVNDIGWNDSLLGRFINHIIRKAKIMIGKMRLKGLIRQLKSTFEDIVSRGRMAAMDSADRLKIIQVQMYVFFYELIQGVENGEKVGVLRRLTEAAIDNLEATEDFDQKDDLLDELEAFLEFLEEFDDDEGDGVEGEEDGEEGEGEEGEGEEGGSGSESSESAYPQMVKNLKALSLILINYKKVVFTKKAVSVKYVTIQGDTLKKIEANPSNKKKLKAKEILAKNQMVTQNGQKKKFSDYFKPGEDKTIAVLPAGLELVLEGVDFLSEEVQQMGAGAGPDRNVIGDGGDHLTQAFTKLKKSIETLISPKDKGIGIDYNSLNELTKKATDDKVKEDIKALYYEVKRYLVGDKKATLNAPTDPLYKESLNISVVKERVIIAEKIARFASRALQFKGTNLEGGLGDLKVPLQDFISSLDIILKSKITVKKEESRLFKYDRFTKLIKEADGDNEDDNKDDDNKDDNKGSKTSQRIREWFNKNCKGVISFTIEEAEAKRLRIEFDKIKPTDFVIDGFDPIIQLIRIFNRAYKIYTTRIISKRSEKVTGGTSGPSAGTAMEYMPLGSNGAEPYRHIKTFDIWEDAVFDILGNREYQEIFDKKTGLRIGDEIREEKGPKLRQFILDMLDGAKLYGREDGGTSAGIQSKFLEEYFGEVDDSATKQITIINNDEGGAEAAEVQTDVEGASVEVSMSKSDNVQIQTPGVGNMFTITSDEINEANTSDKQFTFIVTSIKDGFINLLYFGSIGGFDAMFQKSGNIKQTNIKGDLQSLNVYKVAGNGNRLLRHYTRIKTSDFTNLIKKGSSITMRYVEGEQYNTVKKVNVKIDGLYWLVKKDTDNKKSPFDLEGDSLERAKTHFGKFWNPNIAIDAKIQKYVK